MTAPADAQAGEWVPLSPVDRAMARRMERTAAVPVATEFTHVDVVDAMAAVARLREQGVRATFTTIVLAATAHALAEYPQVAAEVDYETMARRTPASPSVGVAVASDRGLVVPVVRAVVGKPFAELAADLDHAVQAARGGAKDAALYAGGHFTITNIGNLPIYGGVPLPNTPQIAILGVSAAWDAPVVADGEIRASKLARLTLGLDHRALDGITAARFLVAIKDLVEAPDRLEEPA
ncbi:MAG TPA: 2-oxo acid dehydrogenase subunit E2 [Solirubrobacteraceae bacterium]|nr:2-oxo acid dehydrogenase subunit E2 [Solirubrobacteraceae bacterium]